MRYHRLLLASLIAATAALAAAACSTHDNSPSPACLVSVGVQPQNVVSAAATTGSIPVFSSCAWAASSSASFLTITSGASGSGNGTVNYSITTNTGAPRSASIAIGTAIVGVFQAVARAGVECTVTLSATTARINSSGGTVTIDVTVASPCQWGWFSNSPFLTLPQTPLGATGPLPFPTGSGPITITVSPNSGASRIGTVTVGGQTVTITQDGSIRSARGRVFLSRVVLDGASVDIGCEPDDAL
jgi:hypothetical protein